MGTGEILLGGGGGSIRKGKLHQKGKRIGVDGALVERIPK